MDCNNESINGHKNPMIRYHNRLLIVLMLTMKKDCC